MAQARREGSGSAFISYRRDDTSQESESLFEVLASHFGTERIFKDVESIQLGDDFVVQITTAVGACEVLLAVIGPRWLAILDERRLAGSEDFVRVEIETALSGNIRVIPVLVDGAQLPDASQLPDSLKPLARRQAYKLSPDTFGPDTDRLLKHLEAFLEPLALRKIADELAEIVQKQWKRETGLRIFHKEVHMLNVSWQPATDGFESWNDLLRTARERRGGGNAAAQSSGWAATPAELAGSDHNEICAVFGRVPTRRLVVLGEPGAGKTMLLIQLLQGLLDTRRRGDTVPVLVSLASWRPTDEDLYTWLDRRLSIDYPNLRAHVPGQKISSGRALLDTHKILLILDGLDEIPAQDRPYAIKKINSVLNEHPEGLILACRRQDYLDAAKPSASQPDKPTVPLHAAAGIVLQPLRPDEVADYLQRGSRNPADWEPVTAKLGSGAAVGKALTTPLNVTLAHAIYNNPDWQDYEGVVPVPADLLEYPSPEKIEEHLYGTFIRAAYRPGEEAEGKPPPKLEDAQRWLTFLAQRSGLAWWELRESVSSWLAPVVIGLVCGIAAAIAAATGAHDGVGIGMGIGVGMIVGLATGLPFRRLNVTFGWAWLKEADPGDDSKKVKDDARPIRGVTGGFVGGVVGGVAAGLAASLGFGHTASPVSGLPVALGVGLGVGAATPFAGGLVGGALGGFAAAALEGIGVGLPAAIVNGIGLALVVAVIVKFVGRDTPAAQRRWSWPMGVGGGLIIGGAVGIIAGYKESPVIGLILGAAVGAAVAWPVGLSGTKIDRNANASPDAALSRDARAFWVTALAAGGAAAAFAFVGDGLASIFEVHAKFSFPLLLSDGLGVGLTAGIVVGLAFGAYHATWPSFLIARVWLRLRGELPWGFMAFLNDAHEERGVLRQSGAFYEFRHIEIARYLDRTAKAKAGRKQPRPPAPAHAYVWRPRAARSPA